MIDPGHPFAVAYPDVIDALEERLRLGTEQPARWTFPYQQAISAYELPRDANAVTSVVGLVGAVFTAFVEGQDYDFAGNRLIWRSDPGSPQVPASRRPNDGTRFDVEYTFLERRSGLTDFNEGSVVGTLVRVVAREMTAIYDQMDEAYRRAFIDQATGVALDSVVALLGVTRNQTIPARGAVTFASQRATDLTIKGGTRVADQPGRTFVTQADASIPPWREEIAELANGVARTAERIAALTGLDPTKTKVLGVWPATVNPDVSPRPVPLALLPASAASPFGADERTITVLPPSPPAGPSAAVRIRYSPKSATVEVVAAAAGPDGNVPAGTVNVMPTPPPGVSGVSNELAISGGRLAETDDRLRDRAKHELERAGHATLGALRYAVLGIEGVDEVEVIDYAADSSLPPGEVRLRISAVDQARVRQRVSDVIEQTRSAGVRVSTEEIQPVLVAGRFFLIPDANPDPAGLGRFIDAVVAAMLVLPVGAALPRRRLNALAFGIGGLADVAEAQLRRADGVPVGDTLVVDPGQVVRPDKPNLTAVLLDHLSASLPVPSSPPSSPPSLPRPPGVAVALQVRDAHELPMAVEGSLTLDVTVEVTATLQTAPTRPPELVGRHTEQVTFDRSTQALLTASPAWAPDFRINDHAATVNVKISATAYPGLLPATISLKLGA